MFESSATYPTAVASYDDAGVDAAVQWCIDLMEKGDVLTVWTSLKSNLPNCPQLARLVAQYSNVEHITGRGHVSVRGTGPVLMAWADMDDIGKLVRSGSRLRGLCVITWNADGLRPWVTTMQPEILGDPSEWEQNDGLVVDPIVAEALESLTLTINHNNTIAAGFEKDQVVRALLALHDARIPMDAEAMQGWALGHGWRGKNPQLLAKYVTDINGGKRPRFSGTISPDYVDRMRQRAEGHAD